MGLVAVGCGVPRATLFPFFFGILPEVISRGATGCRKAPTALLLGDHHSRCVEVALIQSAACFSVDLRYSSAVASL